MLPNKNPVLDKSYSFSIKIIRCYQHLKTDRQPSDLARQVLKSGTSIGANIEEAQGAQSKKDFIAKMHISYKEAKETHYWLRLFRDTSILDVQYANSLLNDCEEILKLLSTILKSSKQNLY